MTPYPKYRQIEKYVQGLNRGKALLGDMMINNQPLDSKSFSLECAECLEGKSENPSTFSLLERALLDEDWMHLFDSARPSSHH